MRLLLAPNHLVFFDILQTVSKSSLIVFLSPNLPEQAFLLIIIDELKIKSIVAQIRTSIESISFFRP